MSEPVDISGLTVVVTGAGGGLGRAMSMGLASDGATVLGFGRNQDTLRETADLCAGGRMSYFVGDLTEADDCEALFDTANQRMGRVDVLINNAAQMPKVSFLDGPFADWAQSVETNVLGTARCCYLALPGMLNRGFGRILNVGSTHWTAPLPDTTAYSASKGSIRPFTRALASEIDRQRYPDILINEFIPGSFRTGMSDEGGDPAEVYPHVRHVVSLPSGGPTGATFIQSRLYQEPVPCKERVKQLLSRASLGLYRRRSA